MSPRVYEKRFDWDKARRLHEQGESKSSIARRLGVSETAVRRVVDPQAKARMEQTGWAWTHNAQCIDCGAPTTRIRKTDERRCPHCSAIKKATTARPTTLRCHRCKHWKPDSEFPHNRAEKIGRRGRHAICRPCQTIVKREYRRRKASHA